MHCLKSIYIFKCKTTETTEIGIKIEKNLQECGELF